MRRETVRLSRQKEREKDWADARLRRTIDFYFWMVCCCLFLHRRNSSKPLLLAIRSHLLYHNFPSVAHTLSDSQVYWANIRPMSRQIRHILPTSDLVQSHSCQKNHNSPWYHPLEGSFCMRPIVYAKCISWNSFSFHFLSTCQCCMVWATSDAWMIYVRSQSWPCDCGRVASRFNWRTTIIVEELSIDASQDVAHYETLFIPSHVPKFFQFLIKNIRGYSTVLTTSWRKRISSDWLVKMHRCKSI